MRREQLREITSDGVIREGFPDGNVERFLKGFYLLQARMLPKNDNWEMLDVQIPENFNPPLYVINFELVKT